MEPVITKAKVILGLNLQNAYVFQIYSIFQIELSMVLVNPLWKLPN